MNKQVRAEITVAGRVQGVGFRYFVMRNAEELGVTGWTKNLPTGEVFIIAEGRRDVLEELYARLQCGPSSARVEQHSIIWQAANAEYTRFAVR